MEPSQGALALFVAATLLASLAAIARLDADRRWRDVLRDRFVLGVPWGTLVVCCGVLAIYLFVQDGITDFRNPVTIPYRAWSYYYPLGIATASFSHAHDGHLLNNLLGAVVLAPIAEYAWGHYPNGRDGHETTSWWTTPWLRAVVCFPLAVVCVGLLTSAFALGPVIGFSGVVYAFAGFAIVRYPITTIVAALGGQTALLTIYRALRSPIGVYVAEPSPPSPPSWATIAIQGHALGFFVGLVCCLALYERRTHRPNPLRIWIALLLFAFAQGLWAIYWFGGENTYILFQGPGVAIVLALAIVVTLAVVKSDRSLVPSHSSSSGPRRSFPSLVERLRSSGSSNRQRSAPPAEEDVEEPSAESLAEEDSGESNAEEPTTEEPRSEEPTTEEPRSEEPNDTGPDSGPSSAENASTDRTRERDGFRFPSRRRAAFAVVLVVLAVIAGPAIPVNLFVASGESTADGAVTVEDYAVYYDEGVENELASFVDVSLFGQDTQLEASGVIVTSDERHLWVEAVSDRRLAFTGEETVHVGGPGWREAVHVERRGWTAAGNDTVYRVEIWADGEERQLAYESESSQADVRVDHRNVTVASEDGEFLLRIESTVTGTGSSASIPEEGESTMAAGVTFEREDGTVYAVSDGTRVAVASRETYD